MSNILSRAGTYLPEKFAVSLWGENGHVIQELSGNPVFGELGIEWNNTFDREVRFGFLHYTGPMRDLYSFDDEEKLAWQEISLRRFARGDKQSIDRPAFYGDLAGAYRAIAAADSRFAPLQSEWFRGQSILGNHLTAARSSLTPTSPVATMRVHFCHDVDLRSQSTNPYIDQLAAGLVSLLGPDAITFGVSEFWTLDYKGVDALHIQWVEVLCDWKKPDESLIERIAARLDEIKKTTRIVYTLHNIEVKADFDEMADRLMNVICSRADTIIHLSHASVAAFQDRYAAFPWSQTSNAAIIRHGSYDCYFEDMADISTESDVTNHIYICGAIRTRQEWQLAQDVAELAAEAGYPVVFTGNVSSSVLHWKERQNIEQQSCAMIKRHHRRVNTSEMVQYARTARCFFLPRVGRLNSGVWYLATTFGRPCVVPDQMSMREDQQAVDGQCYEPGNARSAFNAIQELYQQSADEIVKNHKQLIEFARVELAWGEICLAHVRAYGGKEDTRSTK